MSAEAIDSEDPSVKHSLGDPLISHLTLESKPWGHPAGLQPASEPQVIIFILQKAAHLGAQGTELLGRRLGVELPAQQLSRMAAPEQPPPEGSKPLSGLLGGIAQAAYYGNADITEELLRGQLYPEAAPEEFRALRAKMGGLLQSIASADMDLNQLDAFLTAQTKKQGGITSDQAAVIAKFWKNHRMKIHESLINQSRWDNFLKNMNWRVDLKSQSRHIDQINTPVAIVEMELGKNGQESEFLCLEFDEAKLSQMLKKLSEIEDSMTLLTQTT